MKCDIASIWNEHKKYMESFIRKRIKDKELADDLIQEVILKMCEFCLKSNDVKNVRNWLFSIARNVISDHFRKEKKKEDLSATLQHEMLADESSHEFASEFVIPLMGHLPEKYRLPLIWSDIDQIPQKEIAQKLNISFSGAKSRVQRARLKLKELFYQCCYLELDINGNIRDCKPKENCNLTVNRHIQQNSHPASY